MGYIVLIDCKIIEGAEIVGSRPLGIFQNHAIK